MLTPRIVIPIAWTSVSLENPNSSGAIHCDVPPARGQEGPYRLMNSQPEEDRSPLSKSGTQDVGLAVSFDVTVRVVKPNLLFCIHQRDSEGIGGCEWECRWLGRA